MTARYTKVVKVYGYMQCPLSRPDLALLQYILVIGSDRPYTGGYCQWFGGSGALVYMGAHAGT